jgi:hypothetical protein
MQWFDAQTEPPGEATDPSWLYYANHARVPMGIEIAVFREDGRWASDHADEPNCAYPYPLAWAHITKPRPPVLQPPVLQPAQWVAPPEEEPF